MFKRLQARWDDSLENHPIIEGIINMIKPWIPPVNFISVHYTYFVSMCLIASLIFWGCPTPTNKISYVDSLFVTASAMTNTGLSPINLSNISSGQQVVLFIVMIIGSPIWVSIWTVTARKRAFQTRFMDIVKTEREMRQRAAAASSAHPVLLRATPLRILSLVTPTKPQEDAADPQRQASAMSGTALDAIPESPAQARVPFPGRGRTSLRQPDEPATKARTESSATADSEATNVEPEQTGAEQHISIVLNKPQRKDRRSPSPMKRMSNYVRTVRRRGTNDSESPIQEEEAEGEKDDDYLYNFKKILGENNVSRNGQFYDLSTTERDQIGGCEYRALKILAFTVPAYLFIWQFMGSLALAAWIANHAPDVTAKYGVNSWWTGFFLGVSSFTNSGLSLIDDSMIPFRQNSFPLLVSGALILAGNTAYPVFLRLALWLSLQILRLTTHPTTMAPWKETLEFILKYPRRVYTTLFPGRPTWWLVFVLIITNCVDWVAFLVMNIGNPVVDQMGNVGQRILGGLYQAISVRAAGLTVVSISGLYIGCQLLFLIMMYISAYPVTITMRNSNVYEERSLGIYEDDDNAKSEEAGLFQMPSLRQLPSRQMLRRTTGAVVGAAGHAAGAAFKKSMTFGGVGATSNKKGEENSRVNFVQQQIRGQLAHDLWWLVLAVMVIVTIETSHFLEDPVVYSLFNILFEGVSAYGCVGLSVGLPNDPFSLCGALRTSSKVVLVLVMIRGRHRGLPVAVDRAVRLPGDELAKEEEEDAKARRTKTMMRLASRDM